MFLDDSYTDSHVGVIPGEYVMLVVTDTGCGIEASVLERIFEPFFTTKGVGKGTGLGLATIYGIVKQHGGNIWVYSEPGHGTTFKVYWPVVLEDVSTSTSPTPAELTTGMATILLLEDNNAVLQVTMRQLQSLGYTVFTATLPSEAEAVLQEQGDSIDLLLTDVVMPECIGPQFYETIHLRYPHLRVLYMSGFTLNAIAEELHNSGAHFLEKPFTINALAQKVHDALK